MKQSIVNQAVVNGSLYSGAVLVGQLDRSLDLNAKVIDPRRLFELVGRYADSSAFVGELALAKVLGCLESGTGTPTMPAIVLAGSCLRRNHSFPAAGRMG